MHKRNIANVTVRVLIKFYEIVLFSLDLDLAMVSARKSLALLRDF